MQRWIPRTVTVKGPKYLALVETIGRDIATGRLNPGDRLPSQREIAEMFGVTVATVTKAIAEGARRGLVTARAGHGTFVAEVSTSPTPDETLINLGLNILPTTVVSDLVSDAVMSVAQEQLVADMFDYASYTGETPDTRALRSWLESQGPSAPRDTVPFPTHGVQQGLLAAMTCLSQPGQTVIVEELSYTGTLRSARFSNLLAYGVAMDSQGVIPDALERAIREQQARIVVLTPTVQNPTGRSMGAERRKKIADICRKHDIFLIEDAINMPLAGCGEQPISSWIPERSILLSGFSKSVASGMRLGFAYVPSSMQEGFHDALVNLGWIAPQVFLTIAARLVQSGAMTECVTRNRAEALERRNIASRVLGKRVDTDMLPAFHVWMNLPSGWTADALSREALALGVSATPTAHFCTANIATPAAIRICLGAVSDRNTLEAGLRVLASIMEKSAVVANPVF